MEIKNLRVKNNKGFTLIELLIYISIFAIAAGLLSGILVIFTRIQGQEAASSEVTQQLSFVQTTIQRLVRESVNIQNPAGPAYASSSLTLRMASSSLDPTVISSDSNAIYLQQGTGSANPLTSDRVKVNQFQVVKYENPGGHAIVQIDLSLSYNSQRLYQQITRSLKTAIGRVTAATFDDNLLPNQDNQFSIGLYPSNRWKYIYLSDGTVALPSYTFGSNTGLGLFRAGDNILGFSTAGAERMRIDASGNVGIGTPGAKLAVGTGEAWNNLATFIESNVGGTSSILVRNSAPTGTIGERAALYLLPGPLTSIADAPGIVGYRIDDASVVAKRDYGLQFRVTENNAVLTAVTILENGNVGIGTTGPGHNLHIAKNANASATLGSAPARLMLEQANNANWSGGEAAAEILFKKGDDIVGAIRSEHTRAGGPHSYEDAGLTFYVAPNVETPTAFEAMRIDYTGNVGIGTSAPATNLHLYKTGEASSTLGAAPSVLTLEGIDTAGWSGGEAIAELIFKKDGDIVGAIRSEHTRAGGPHSYEDAGLTFYVAPSAETPTAFEAMRIDYTGNVGIGTTGPQSALHVPDGKYAQFEDNNAGAPPAADCNSDTERGRISIDTTNNWLYICNGATRGWDYIALTN